MLQRSALHDYQRATVDFIVKKRKCACWLSLGLGKTVGAATAVSDLIDSFQAQRTLIVAPKLVSRFSWTNELANWEQLGHMSITTRDQMVGVKSVPSPTRRSEEEEKYIDTKWVARECRMILKEDHEHCNGNTAKLYRNTTTWIRNFHRDRLLEFDTDISIINVENFQWLVETMRGAWPWDTIIMDESAMFRTPGSGRFKAYTDIAHKVDNLIQLTATPAPNGYLGLWAQIFMIDGGKRLGRTYTAFRDNFFIQSFNGYSYNLRPGMKDVIDDKIKDVVISMDAGDHLELQPEVIEDIVLTLPNKLRPLYDELAKEFYLSLPDGEVDVETMAILSSKLRQFCIIEGTEVLTDRGWVPIETVTAADRVWDGEVFASCNGSVYNGCRTTVPVWGVAMTPDHLVLTDSGWVRGGDIHGKPSKEYTRSDFRLPYGYSKRRSGVGREKLARNLALPVCLREKHSYEGFVSAMQKTHSQVVRVYGRLLGKNPRPELSPVIQEVDSDERSVLLQVGQGLQKLWSERYSSSTPLARLSKLLRRFNRYFRPYSVNGSRTQQWSLRAGECKVYYSRDSGEQHQTQSIFEQWDDSYSSSEVCRAGPRDSIRQIAKRLGGEGRVKSAVYDIVNAGSRNRYMVRNSDGYEFIVHNCSGAMYASDEDRTVIDVHNMKVDALRDITEATGGIPMIMVYDFKPEKAKIIKAFSNRSIVLRTSNDFDQDEWDAGLVDYLLLHPKSGGHGLNLQHGTNLMAHSSLTWDLELYQQINGRMNPTRQFQSGYNRPSVYYRVYFQDTVESNVVVPMLADKAATQKSLLEAVKYNLRSEYG